MGSSAASNPDKKPRSRKRRRSTPPSYVRPGHKWAAVAWKLRVIYFPYLAISAGFVIAYTLLVRLFLMRHGMYVIPEMLALLVIPFGLVWLPLILWVRPRLKILRLWDGTFRRLALLSFALLAPTIAAQYWLAAEAGELAHVNRISEINAFPDTKFFVVDSLFADKNQFSYHIKSELGNRNSSLWFTLGLVIPLRDAASDTSLGPRGIWLGQKFRDHVGATANDSVKTRALMELIKSSLTTLVRQDLNGFTVLERVGEQHRLRSVYVAAIQNSVLSDSQRPPTILEGHTEPLEERVHKCAMWTAIAYGLGALAALLVALISRIDARRLSQYLKGRTEKDDSLASALAEFTPRQGYAVTPVLIILTTGVLAAMVCCGSGVDSFQTKDLIRWGANCAPLVRDGEWWRLVTAVFLHGGLMHLANNMVLLWIAGRTLEPVIGSMRLAIVYLTTGLVGSIVSALWHPAGVGVGASGAIFGLCGLWIFCAKTKRKNFKSISRLETGSIIFCVGLNLVLGFLPGPVDNAAHFGGLLSGAVLGALLIPRVRRRGKIKVPDGIPADLAGKD
jgi:rhomboid protease GluP